MLTKEEKDFVAYWESHREREGTFWRKMFLGGPWGLIFALPILLAVLFHDWYKRMVPISPTMMVLIFIFVIGIAFFYAFFRQQVIWERNEQHYKELKIKEQRENQG